MRIEGNIERFDRRVISGWLYFFGGDDEKPVVEALYDGEVIGEARADGYRRDLEEAGFGNGTSEFSIPVPDAVQPDIRRVRLRLKGTEIYLTHPSLFDGIGPTTPDATRGLKVFVSGAARSGTSIMFLALQSALGLSGTGEGHILPIFQNVSYAFFKYAERFRDNSGVLASHLNAKRFSTVLHTEVRAIYENLFPGGDFIDKTPGHEAIDAMRIARAAFPDCKIIIMRRNGIEVVDSFVKKFSADFEAACVEWSASIRATTSLRTVYPDALVLDQFMLKTAPSRAARLLTDYLETPDSADAIATYLRDNEIDKLSERTSETPIRISDTSWPDSYVRMFLATCGPEMLTSGYEL